MGQHRRSRRWPLILISSERRDLLVPDVPIPEDLYATLKRHELTRVEDYQRLRGVYRLADTVRNRRGPRALNRKSKITAAGQKEYRIISPGVLSTSLG